MQMLNNYAKTIMILDFMKLKKIKFDTIKLFLS